MNIGVDGARRRDLAMNPGRVEPKGVNGERERSAWGLGGFCRFARFEGFDEAELTRGRAFEEDVGVAYRDGIDGQIERARPEQRLFRHGEGVVTGLDDAEPGNLLSARIVDADVAEDEVAYAEVLNRFDADGAGQGAVERAVDGLLGEVVRGRDVQVYERGEDEREDEDSSEPQRRCDGGGGVAEPRYGVLVAGGHESVHRARPLAPGVGALVFGGEGIP